MNNDRIEIIRKLIPILRDVEHVYCFGSALFVNAKPNDIDILIIYQEYTNAISQQIKKFAQEAENASGLKVDLTILSKNEEKELRFLDRISSLQFK